MTIYRQLFKMTIFCLKREKTPKYTEKQAEKANNLFKKLTNLLYRSKCCEVLDDEKSKCQDNIRFAGKEKYPTK